MKYVELDSGNKMPMVGFGTFTLTGDVCRESVEKAIELGYTHIDTAEIYENEKEVGQGIKTGLEKTSLTREDLFVTSKVWKDNLHYDEVIEACEGTLDDLGLDYLDLYLIHWPNSDIPMEGTFKALAKLKKDGKIKDIGVSNFTTTHLKKAQKVSSEPISINQVEYHPYLNQNKLLNYCKENGIAVTAFSPLGNAELLTEKPLVELAKKVDKSLAQVILKWLVDKDIIVIPRSTSTEHMKENLDLFSWDLPEEVFNGIEQLDKKRRVRDPEFGEFDMEE